MKPYPFRDYHEVKARLIKALDSDEPYLLLTDETGTGKTALVRDLQAKLDRCRFRVFYFAGAQKLSPMGLIRVLLRSMRVSSRPSHSERAFALIQAIKEEPQQVLLIFDDAHDLSQETLTEARSLAESPLDTRKIQILLVGLPSLREKLASCSQLWRRFCIREEITGLRVEELIGFLQHHFPDDTELLNEEGFSLLFESAKGTPGLILPLFKRLVAKKPEDREFRIHEIEEIVQSWILP